MFQLNNHQGVYCYALLKLELKWLVKSVVMNQCGRVAA